MNLLKFLINLSSITLLSRILGFIRDTIISYKFGIGIMSDSFFMACKIPNILKKIFADGIFSQTFIPILTLYKNKHKDNIKKNQLFISYIFGFLMIILILISTIGILFSPYIINIIAPGFIKYPEKHALTIKLLRIIFPCIILVSINSLIGSILNTWNQFIIPACTPIILNISIIIFSLILIPYFNPPIIALGWSIIIGSIIQIIYQIPALKKNNMLVKPIFNYFTYHHKIKKILKYISYNIINMSILQISFIFNTILISFLSSGPISWIYYANKLTELPSGIIGAGLNTILMTTLSNTIIKNDNHEYSRLLNWSLKICFILALPVSVMLGILSYPIINILFQHGMFSKFDTIMTQQILILNSIGLTAIILIKILSTNFYSHLNLNSLIKINIITVCCIQIINIISIKSLQHIAIVLSSNIGYWIHAFLLYRKLIKQKQFPFNVQKDWCLYLFKIILSISIMGLYLIYLLYYYIIPNWIQYSMLLKILILTIIIITATIIYYLSLKIVQCNINFSYLYNIKKNK